MKRTINLIVTGVVMTALMLGYFVSAKASPASAQLAQFSELLAPGNTSGWVIENSGSMERVTALSDRWDVEAGGYAASTHYARFKYKICEQSGIALTTFYMKMVLVLPDNFYSEQNAGFRIMNTDNYTTTLNGSTIGANDEDESRTSVYINSNHSLRLIVDHETVSSKVLYISPSPLPVGEHTVELFGDLDSVAPWYLRIDGVVVASGTEMLTMDTTSPAERVATRFVTGIDGAADQDSNTMNLQVKSFEIANYDMAGVTTINPTPTAVPPTATQVPPTPTAVPPTATQAPPSPTALPPTVVPPSATAVPPTVAPILPAGGSSITLQPDGAAGVDTYLLSSSATSNYGTAGELGVGENNDTASKFARSLIRFDLSSVPAGATITSAKLSLWTSADLSNNNRTLRVYRLMVPFNETQATWNLRSSGVAWQAAGASGANDRESTDIGSVQILAGEVLGIEKQIGLSASKIQEMVNGTFANNGFVLAMDTEQDDRFNYKSSDSSLASSRPKLMIEYTLGGGATPVPPTQTAVLPTATLPLPTATAVVPPTNTAVPPTSVPPSGSVDLRISAGLDDVEELANGSMDVNSSDIELVYDTSNMIIGLRFNGVNIPRNAVITNAYVQFKVDEKATGAIALNIQGQLTPNAPEFSTMTRSVSSLARTSQSVSWAPAAWPIVGAAGANQRTPNLAPVIQAIVNQSNWAPGNSLALIITGSGKRVAESYEGERTSAPLLHIEFSAP